MRVIRTEFYFDQNQIRPAPGYIVPPYPGVSVAWFRNPFDASTSFEFLNAVLPLLVPAEVKTFLDAALYEGLNMFAPNLPDQFGAPELNTRVVNYMLEQEIVIERSPPVGVPLSTLLGHATNFSVGSYLGYAMAGGDIPLMFVTVPLGVIVMGAATGVSNGLKNGLQKRIEEYFSSRGSEGSTRGRGREREHE